LTTTKDIGFCGAKLPKRSNVILFNKYMVMNADKARVKDVPLGPGKVSTTVFYPERYLVQEQPNGPWTCPSPKPGTLAFPGFGFGARTCPGRTYSESLTYTLLIGILQNFNVELAPGTTTDARYVFRTIMMPDFEIYLKVTKRNK